MTHVLMKPGVGRVLETLAKPQRRRILLALRDGVAEHEDDVVMRGGDDAIGAKVLLRHTDLPNLVDKGYIEWDPETGAISKGPDFDEIEPLLNLIENHADELPPDWP